MLPRWPRSRRISHGLDAPQKPEVKVAPDNGAWRVEQAVAGFRRSGDRADRAPARSRELRSEAPVSAAELAQVAHEYRRLHAEHRAARPRSRARRQLGRRLERLRGRFEHLLGDAPLSDADLRLWETALRGAPPGPAPAGEAEPLLYRGRSATGSELRLTCGAGGTVTARVDGAAVEVLDDARELTGTAPGFVFALDGIEFRETFGSSSAALEELRDAVETGRRPVSARFRELLEDGLVDGTTGLTARGRRALALDRDPARHSESAPAPSISTRGPIEPGAPARLADALVHTARAAPRPVLAVTASLTRHEDRAVERPVEAKATVVMNGRTARARAEAGTERDAIDRLEARLVRILRSIGKRDLARRRREKHR
jgi:hypothetical protein